MLRGCELGDRHAVHSKMNLSGSELVQDRDGRTFYFPAWIKAGPFI